MQGANKIPLEMQANLSTAALLNTARITHAGGSRPYLLWSYFSAIGDNIRFHLCSISLLCISANGKTISVIGIIFLITKVTADRLQRGFLPFHNPNNQQRQIFSESSQVHRLLSSIDEGDNDDEELVQRALRFNWLFFEAMAIVH